MTIQQIYNSYYKHIQRDVFKAAVAADPTSYNQGEVVKVGNFVKWILKLYQNNAWKPGDRYETRDLLGKFIKYKSKLPVEKRDINRYNSIHDIYLLIQSLEGQGVKSQKDVKREGAEVVYEDSEWKIVIPHTEEASCIYGAHTKWCTAGRGGNMFDYYNEKGPLYININKQNGDKYQFHFESGSFRNAEDKKISLKNIGLSEGTIEYYKSIGKELYFIYDEVGGFSEGFAWVYVYGRGYNFIDTNGELLWSEYKNYDKVDNFSEGFAKVGIEGKGWNFINKQCELLWKEDKWFDDACRFSNGFARVKYKGKWNFIKTNCELLWKGDKWFDRFGFFFGGFAIVKIKDKGWNFIKTNGELLWKGNEWFDNVSLFHDGFAIVKIEGRGCNFINTNGELLWKGDKWFDDVWNFSEGFARVKIKDKGYNFINPNGELLWSEYKNFDFVWYFSEGFAPVYKEGKGRNYINEQGELLWKEDKWFDATCVWDFSEGFAKVKYNNNCYKLNTKGELIEN